MFSWMFGEGWRKIVAATFPMEVVEIRCMGLVFRMYL